MSEARLIRVERADGGRWVHVWRDSGGRVSVVSRDRKLTTIEELLESLRDGGWRGKRPRARSKRVQA
jgi:hypothetical protein